MPTRVCRFTGPGAHARIPYPTPQDVVFTAWAPSPPLARQLIGRTGVRAAPLFERHWGSAARWAGRPCYAGVRPCLKGDSSMRTYLRPLEPRSGHIVQLVQEIWSRYATDMFYYNFADSRRGCNPRGAMVRGLQLGSWGRGAWNLVFNHITRDGEPAGARRGLRGRHRRAPREPAPQARPRRINSSCAASEPRTGTRLVAHTHAAPPVAAVRARTPTEGDFWGVARADSSGARPWPAMSTAPPISGHRRRVPRQPQAARLG